MTDYKITNNFDDTLLIWGAIGYTLKELKVDLEIYCKQNNTNIKDYTISKIK